MAPFGDLALSHHTANVLAGQGHAPDPRYPIPASPAQQLATAAVTSSATVPPAHQRRTQRLARYTMVRDLRAQRVSIRDIARQLRMGRQTVRRFAVADHFPERATRRPLPSKLNPYVGYLRQQLAAGHTNGLQLWRELRDQQGYTGARALVSRWVAHDRHLAPAPADAPPQRRGRPPA